MDTMQYNESQSYGQSFAVRSALVSRLSVSTLSADMGGGEIFHLSNLPESGQSCIHHPYTRLFLPMKGLPPGERAFHRSTLTT